MSEKSTDAETLRMPTFEELVLKQLEAIGGRLGAVEKTLESEIKPIHIDVIELSKNVKSSFGDLQRKLDLINKEFFQMKADKIELEERLKKLESEVHPQVIVQTQDY